MSSISTPSPYQRPEWFMDLIEERRQRLPHIEPLVPEEESTDSIESLRARILQIQTERSAENTVTIQSPPTPFVQRLEEMIGLVQQEMTDNLEAIAMVAQQDREEIEEFRQAVTQFQSSLCEIQQGNENLRDNLTKVREGISQVQTAAKKVQDTHIENQRLLAAQEEASGAFGAAIGLIALCLSATSALGWMLGSSGAKIVVAPTSSSSATLTLTLPF